MEKALLRSEEEEEEGGRETKEKEKGCNFSHHLFELDRRKKCGHWCKNDVDSCKEVKFGSTQTETFSCFFSEGDFGAIIGGDAKFP